MASVQNVLHVFVFQDEFATASSRVKDRGADRHDEVPAEGFIDGKLSRQILNQAKTQMLELEQECSGGVIKKKLTSHSKFWITGSSRMFMAS